MEHPAMQANPQPKAGGVQEMIGNIHTDLLKLKEVLGNAPAAKMLDGLIDGYREFVKGLLGGGASMPRAGNEPAAPVGPVPMHQGVRGLPA